MSRLKDFKYPVLKLIDYVKVRPCLWDKTVDDYKDRVERRTAWEEIFKILEANYEQMNSEDKRLTEEAVTYKWTNIRDTFIKSLKAKTGKPKKKYMLYNNLEFLKKIIPETDGDKNSKDLTSEDPITISDVDPDTSFGSRKRSTDNEVTHTLKSKRKNFENNDSKSRRRRKSPRIIFESDSVEEIDDDDDDDEADEIDDPRLMNEDEAFFASLLPTVVQYSEDEKLEFRIEVLSLMKKIKERSKGPSDEL